jgi:hypothetical protein
MLSHSCLYFSVGGVIAWQRDIFGNNAKRGSRCVTSRQSQADFKVARYLIPHLLVLAYEFRLSCRFDVDAFINQQQI